MTDAQGKSTATAARSRFGSRSRLLLVLVLCQILFLLGLAGSYYATDWWGEEIRLQTKPVDPRDLLYGDYVTLSYEISQLDPSLWQDAEQPKRGESIYVVLKPDTGGVYRPTAAYGDKPAVSAEEAVLKGRVNYSWDRAITVQYGLERFYVPEGTGQELEEAARDTIVRVKIAPWGQSRLIGLGQ